jgi:hypothetical protein
MELAFIVRVSSSIKSSKDSEANLRMDGDDAKIRGDVMREESCWVRFSC